jgi:WD40 repeat protein
MELVKGIALTDYCDQSQLTPRERLELFVHVCQAVQHAHLKGVIHRDLKPSNVLVTEHDGTPVVKVIDFGVAKAIGQRLTEKTIYTGFTQMIGTSLYMSPEQAALSGLDIDTRSDVFALGVLLYELLTGTTPLDSERLLKAGLDEMRRMIREEEPPTPSKRLSTLGATLATTSAKRRIEPAKLTALVRGELDWIVMKCLEKDRNRRYETPNNLAEDIRRYLQDEPVQAGPPSPLYRLRKFLKRNRALVLAGSLVLLALLAGIVGTTWGLVEAIHQQGITEQARKDAEEEKRLANIARDDADEKRRLANEARKQEEKQRIRAEWLANDAQIVLAGRDLDDGDIGGARDVLGACREDLRLFEWGYLWRLCQRRLRAFHVHRQPVLSVAFSPDGKHIASTAILYLLSQKGELKFWDPLTGKENLFLKSRPPFLLQLAFSPDGKRVAGLAFESLQPTKGELPPGVVMTWELATGRELFTIKEPFEPRLVAYSPDGKLITAFDRTVKWWDSETGRELRSVQLEGAGDASSFTISADCRRLANASGGGNTRVWDLQGGKQLLTLRAQNTGSVTAVALSPDGKQIATATAATAGGPIRVWNNAGKEVLLLTGHADDVTAIAFSPDGRRLASSGDRTVRIWDARTGRKLVSLKGHSDSILCLAFAPDGKTLATGDAKGYVNLWDLSNQDAVVCEHNWGVRAAFSPDGSKLVSGSDSLRIWDPANGKELRVLKGNMHNGVFSIAWRPDGRQIVSGHHDGAIQAWDAIGDKTEPTFKQPRYFAPGGVGNGTGNVYALAYSPDGKRLASASHDKTVKMWDTATGQLLFTFKKHADEVVSVAFSLDGYKIASLGARDKLMVWDAATGRTIFSRPVPHGEMVFAVAFSPDGHWLAAASSNRTITFLDASAGKEAFTLKGHNNWITCLAFSADSQRLVSGSKDQTVRIWDLHTQREVLSLKRHGAEIYSVAFDKSGQRIASASKDRTVRIWDATPVR